MGNAEKTFMEKRENNDVSRNWGYEKRNDSTKKTIIHHENRKKKSSTTESKYDKHDNKISIHETIKEIDKKTVTKKTLPNLQGI